MMECELRKFKFWLETYLSKELVEEIATAPQWECNVVDAVANMIKLQIRGSIYGEELDTRTIKCPADWWQHFKERWFPEWAKRRWPVEYRIETLTARALYPHIQGEQHVIHFIKSPDDTLW